MRGRMIEMIWHVLRNGDYVVKKKSGKGGGRKKKKRENSEERERLYTRLSTRGGIEQGRRKRWKNLEKKKWYHKLRVLTLKEKHQIRTLLDFNFKSLLLCLF